jgi:hypothetical protein
MAAFQARQPQPHPGLPPSASILPRSIVLATNLEMSVYSHKTRWPKATFPLLSLGAGRHRDKSLRLAASRDQCVQMLVNDDRRTPSAHILSGCCHLASSIARGS